MKSFLAISFLFLSHFAMAHPGIGIVKDSRGNIFYTDLKQVWKISPEGKKQVAVPRVHTHELYMDKHDNLYGEHLWYNGERLDTWGSYAWCLRNNGSLDTVKGPLEGFLENYSFARDSAGNQYWAERFTVSRIKMKTPEGRIEVVAEGRTGEIRWLHVTPGGVVFFISGNGLYKIENRKLTLFQKNLTGPETTTGRRAAMTFGIWTDPNDHVYVAVFSERKVIRIATDGSVSDFVFSKRPWAPTGGVFDNQGQLWLLEWNLLNQARVRKIDPLAAGQKTETRLFGTQLWQPGLPVPAPLKMEDHATAYMPDH